MRGFRGGKLLSQVAQTSEVLKTSEVLNPREKYPNNASLPTY